MRPRIKSGLLALSVIALPMMLTGAPADAATMTIEFGGVLSGGSPAGTAPWITATFDDNSPHCSSPSSCVGLTVDATDLAAGQFVSELYFNSEFTVIPGVTKLLFGIVSGPNPVGGASAVFDNAYQADGAGYFDIKFEFDSEFTGGMTGEYYILATNSAAIDVNTFDLLSCADPLNCGPGMWHGAALVSGSTIWLGGEKSVAAAVPEPATLLLLGTSLAAAGIRRRMKKRT